MRQEAKMGLHEFDREFLIFRKPIARLLIRNCARAPLASIFNDAATSGAISAFHTA